MQTMLASEAEGKLSELIRRAAGGESVALIAGEHVAVLAPARIEAASSDELETPELAEELVMALKEPGFELKPDYFTKLKSGIGR